MRLNVSMSTPLHEMAREEISKQLPFLSRAISHVGFSADARTIECDVPDAQADALRRDIKAMADEVQRSLRGLQRKVVFRSRAVARPVHHQTDQVDGIHRLGEGQFALEGLPLRLFNYFDRQFEQLSRRWRAEALLTPALIPSTVLAKCDYFRSFPQCVTFATHLEEDASRVNRFRSRHDDLQDLDRETLHEMAPPHTCLSPALCYHVYHLNEQRTLAAAGRVYAVSGRCFRYESGNLSDLQRLWDFTMREIVFLGSRVDVLRSREQVIEQMTEFMDAHDLAAEIRTASDPFFVAGDNLARTYFQLSSETKYEMSLCLPEGNRLACGSFNYHGDFFGRRFAIEVEGAGPMHSVCVGFGLERWVHAFLAQHGMQPASWPSVVREAPEFSAEPELQPGGVHEATASHV